MKPEKFISIMVITLLLSCEMEEQVEQQLGEVSFETNQYKINSSFEIDIYIDGVKIESRSNTTRENGNYMLLAKKLDVGIHNYEVKIYTYNGEPSKSIEGRFMIQENKTSEVFIDFKNYNSWI
ncbi:hypothetical protein ACFLS4_01435 [Bacteroidota bacterium]